MIIALEALLPGNLITHRKAALKRNLILQHFVPASSNSDVEAAHLSENIELLLATFRARPLLYKYQYEVVT